MEASKRVVFVSFRGPGDGKTRGRRKRALGCVRGFGEPRGRGARRKRQTVVRIRRLETPANTNLRPLTSPPLTPLPTCAPIFHSVSETATWHEFLGLIKARLQLKSVTAVLHASSMTPLTSMDELQDIEDLVVEGQEDAGDGVVGKKSSVEGSGAGIMPGIGRTGLAPAPVAVDVSPSRRGGMDGEDGEADKYKKRSSTLMQAVQSCAPSWTGAVPESMRGNAKRDDDLDAMEGGRGTPSRRRGESHRGGGTAEKKHRRSDPRVAVMALSLLSCFATMALLYSRLSAKLPPP